MCYLNKCSPLYIQSPLYTVLLYFPIVVKLATYVLRFTRIRVVASYRIGYVYTHVIDYNAFYVYPRYPNTYTALYLHHRDKKRDR